MFTQDSFWSLMDLINMDLVDKEADYTAIEPVVEALSTCDADDIFAFQEILCGLLYDLDTELNYKRSCKTADGFLYQRCYVLAEGKESYEALLKNPIRMPHELSWCEALLDVAQLAWEASQDSKWSYTSKLPYETGSNRERWAS